MTKQELIGTKEQRLTRIGGSEFATVLGINPYKKRIELILEKAGVIANTFEGNEATKRGEFLENDVIAMFEDKTGLQVTNEQQECVYNSISLKIMPLVCHLDGITSDGAVFEAKTTDINSKTWKNGIPDYYKAQLDFNCALANKRKAYIAVGHCKYSEIVNFEYYEYTPEREMDEVIEVCKQFSDEVESFKNRDVINNGKIIKTDISNKAIAELENINEEISQFKLQLKPLEDRKKELEDIIKKEIGINNGIQTNKYRITLGNRITSPSMEYKICRSGLKIEHIGG